MTYLLIWFVGWMLAVYPTFAAMLRTDQKSRSSAGPFVVAAVATLAAALWPLALPFVASHAVHRGWRKDPAGNRQWRLDLDDMRVDARESNAVRGLKDAVRQEAFRATAKAEEMRMRDQLALPVPDKYASTVDREVRKADADAKEIARRIKNIDPRTYPITAAERVRALEGKAKANTWKTSVHDVKEP